MLTRLFRTLRNLWRTERPRTLDSRAAYRQWAASYPPTAHNRLMQLEQTAMLALLPDVRGQTALDLACGSGRYGLILRERGAARVIGLDNSLEMLQQAIFSDSPSSLAERGLGGEVNSPALNAAIRSASEVPFSICQAEIDAIPLPASAVDCLICGMAFGHVPNLRMCAGLLEIGRVLKPGGVALVSDFHPYMALSGRQRTFTAADGRQYAVEHHIHLIADYFAAASAAGLTIDSLQEIRPEGGGFPAVLILRLRKSV